MKRFGIYCSEVVCSNKNLMIDCGNKSGDLEKNVSNASLYMYLTMASVYCKSLKAFSLLSFQVPLVPFFPLVSGMLNVFFLVAAVDKGSAIGYFSVVTLGKFL